jgi:hypothetical protein
MIEIRTRYRPLQLGYHGSAFEEEDVAGVGLLLEV